MSFGRVKFVGEKGDCIKYARKPDVFSSPENDDDFGEKRLRIDNNPGDVDKV